MLEEVKPIECYHGVSIDIGGVEVKLPIFIVEHGNADVILGRLWERAVRLAMKRVSHISLDMLTKGLSARTF